MTAVTLWVTENGRDVAISCAGCDAELLVRNGAHRDFPIMTAADMHVQECQGPGVAAQLEGCGVRAA